MSVQEDVVQLRIVVNGDSARKQLAKLDQEAIGIKSTMKGLKKGTAEWIAENKKLEAVEKQMAGLRKQIGLTGMTMRQLRNEGRRLRALRDNLTPGTQAFKEISAQIDKVNARMQQVRAGGNALTRTWGKVNKVLGGLGPQVAIGVIAQKTIRFLADSVRALRVQEKAEATLTTALKGQEAVRDRLIAQAKELQKVTLFGDEETIRAQALAASMGLTEQQITKMIPVAQDLSTVTGMSLDSAVKNLARTYGGLSGELGEQIPALRTLTQEQMRAGEAIDLVADLMGGQAEAAAGADGGAKQLSNAWGDLKEQLGGLLNELFNFEDGNSTLTDIVQGLGDGVNWLSQKVKSAKQFFSEWYDESIEVRIAFEGLIAGAKTLGRVAWTMFNLSFIQPIKAVMTGIKALRHAMAGEWEDAERDMVGFTDGLAKVFKDAAEGIQNDWQGALENMANKTKATGREIGAGVTAFFDAVRKGEAKANAEAAKATEERAKAMKKELELRKKMIAEIDQLEQDVALKGMDPDQAEIERVHLKYDKLREAHKGHQEDLRRLDDLEQKELDDIAERRGQEYLKNREQFQEQVTLATLEGQAREVAMEMAKWDAMIEQAEQYGLSAADLVEAREAALADINRKWDEKELQQKQQHYAIMSDVMGQFAGALQGFNQLIAADGDRFAEHNKGLVLLQITLAQAAALANGLKAAMNSPTVPLALGQALLIAGTVGTYFAQVKALFKSAPEVPAYEHGVETIHGTGVLHGPSHSDPSGGLHIINPNTGQLVATAEGDEMMLSKKFKRNNPQMVAPLMRASHTGEKLGWFGSNRSAFGMPQFAEGTVSLSGAPSYFSNEGFQLVKASIDHLTGVVANQQQAIRAVVSHREFSRAQSEYSDLKSLNTVGSKKHTYKLHRM